MTDSILLRSTLPWIFAFVLVLPSLRASAADDPAAWRDQVAAHVLENPSSAPPWRPEDYQSKFHAWASCPDGWERASVVSLGAHLVTGTTMFIARLKFVWRVYAVPGTGDALCAILDLPEQVALSPDELMALEEARRSAMVVIPRDREREARLRMPSAACPENARQYQTTDWMATYPGVGRVTWSESVLAHGAVCFREFRDSRGTVVTTERAAELRELARAYPSFVERTVIEEGAQGL